MRFAETNRVLAQLALGHHQLIRIDLAEAAGVPRRAVERRVASGWLEHVDREIYRVSSSEATWHQRALTAVWTQGPDALLSHRAAARLWRLEGVSSAPFEVLTERWMRRQRRPNVMVHETNHLMGTDRTEVDGIQCTSVVRTLLDVAGVLHPFRTDQLFEDATRKRLCTPDEVAERFVRFARRGRRGTRTMRVLLAKRVGREVPTMSEFERRFLDVVTRARVASPQLQFPVELPSCTVYLDFAWTESRVAAECDGLYDHGTNLRLVWDDDRQNELVLKGWLVLRFTWETLTTQPDVVIRQLTEALSARARRPA